MSRDSSMYYNRTTLRFQRKRPLTTRPSRRGVCSTRKKTTLSTSSSLTREREGTIFLNSKRRRLSSMNTGNRIWYLLRQRPAECLSQMSSCVLTSRCPHIVPVVEKEGAGSIRLPVCTWLRLFSRRGAFGLLTKDSLKRSLRK